MATYNGAKFLPEQLNSIAMQTRLPAELVVFDDASTDGTCDIIGQFANSAPFDVRLFVNPERLGWRSNFMRCAKQTSSKYVSFCDQDDIWHKDKLSECMLQIEREQVLLVHHNAVVVDEHGVPTGNTLKGSYKRFTEPGEHSPLWSIPPGFTMVFDRRLLNLSELWETSIDSVYPNERAGHDQWIFFLASLFGRIAYLSLCLSAYRQHQNNAVGFRSEVKRLIESRASRADGVRKQLAIVRNREMLLRLMGEKYLACINCERYENALRNSDELAAKLGRLDEAYRSKSLIWRASALVVLLLRQTYSIKRWNLGRQALLKDAANLLTISRCVD